MRLEFFPKLLVGLLALPQWSAATQYPGCKSGVYSSVGCALRNYPPAQTYCSKKVPLPKQTSTVTAPTSTITTTVSTTTTTTTLSIATSSVTPFSTTVTVSTSSTIVQTTTSINTVTQTSTSTATTTVATTIINFPNAKRDAVAGRPTPNPQAARFSSLCKQPNQYITSVCKCVVKPKTTTITTTPSTTKRVVATSTLSTTATVTSTFTATILTTTTIVVTEMTTQMTATSTLTTTTTTTSVTTTQTCPPTQPTYCPNRGYCINSDNDYLNCGACDNECSGPGNVCQRGSCSQAPNVCQPRAEAYPCENAASDCLCYRAVMEVAIVRQAAVTVVRYVKSRETASADNVSVEIPQVAE
ncbi:unnamed protein product [Cercospora beticola]|nr:unnamed protein product [Cercospora beticola]